MTAMGWTVPTSGNDSGGSVAPATGVQDVQDVPGVSRRRPGRRGGR